MDVFITITAINWSCVATTSNLEVPYCFILHTSGVSGAKFNWPEDSLPCYSLTVFNQKYTDL